MLIVFATDKQYEEQQQQQQALQTAPGSEQNVCQAGQQCT
jgi:hypothetical protein